MTSKLYILLPVHNRRAITEKFIDCLTAQTYTNYHLILIDDGSMDGTSEMVGARVANLTIIRGVGDWWWAGSLQQGINWLKSKATKDNIVLIINDDVTFSSNFLYKATALLEQFDGMILPKVINASTGRIEESGVEFNLKRLTFKSAITAEKINCLPTRGLFMRMEKLLAAGDFHPKILPHYLSDYEFTIRAHRRGIALFTSDELLICVDDAATGYRSFDDLSLLLFFKRFFSIKSAKNPVYWTAFIILVSPIIHWPWHITKVWLAALRMILKQVRLKF